jgi:hypothetical protein
MDPALISPEEFDRGPVRLRPRKLLREGVSSVSESADLRWHAASSEREPWDEIIRIAFATLLDYSLIQWSNADRGHNMHQLVHSWTFDRLSGSEAHLFSTVMLLIHEDQWGLGGLADRSIVICLERLASIPDASLSDGHVTLNRFGTLGAYNEMKQSDAKAGFRMCFSFKSKSLASPKQHGAESKNATIRANSGTAELRFCCPGVEGLRR